MAAPPLSPPPAAAGSAAAGSAAASSSAALSAASGPRAGVAGGTPATPARKPTPEHKLASRSAPSSGSERSRGHEPYSVQIDAVMDRQGAEDIARKLSAGGYEPYIVPTEIDGQTWYKVRVGHYETEEAAREAEQRLRLEYEGVLPTH